MKPANPVLRCQQREGIVAVGHDPQLRAMAEWIERRQAASVPCGSIHDMQQGGSAARLSAAGPRRP